MKRYFSYRRFPCEQTFASLLKALGVTDMEIKNMALVMDFGSILKDWKNTGNKFALFYLYCFSLWVS